MGTKARWGDGRQRDKEKKRVCGEKRAVELDILYSLSVADELLRGF